MDKIQQQVEDEVRELGTTIGLRPGFYERLLDEPTDWAFLIQLQVVVEAVIAERMAKALKQDTVFEHLARLAFDGKTGKLQLALSLGVLDSTSAEALRALAACRNRFANRTANTGGTLSAFGESLDANTKLDLMKRLGSLGPHEESAEREAGFPDFGSHLRHRIWMSTAIALAQLGDTGIHQRLMRLQRQLESARRAKLGPIGSTPRTLLDFYPRKASASDTT
jgi:hypothetical protein